MQLFSSTLAKHHTMSVCAMVVVTCCKASPDAASGDSNTLRNVDAGESSHEMGEDGDTWIDAGAHAISTSVVADTEVAGPIDSATPEWREIATPPLCASMHGLSFADELKGWVVGDDGCILHTADGGESWQQQTSPITAGLNAVVFVDGNNGWAVGDLNTVLHTADGGATWNRQEVAVENEERAFLTLFFMDENIGWIGGNHPAILYTTDGGESWEQGDLNTRWTVTGLHFVDAEEGFAVATNRELLHTTDGGRHWTTKSLENLEFRGTVIFESITFSSSKKGWIGINGFAESSGIFVMEGVPVVYTNDGGENWQVATPPESSDLFNEFVFVDSQTGWLFGNHRILATRDGGASWQLQFETTDHVLVDLSPVDETHAWALGFDGTMFKLHPGEEITGEEI